MRFRGGGSPGLPQLPAAQANTSARPRGYLYAVAIGGDRQSSSLGTETNKTAVSVFLAWPRCRAALDRRPPLRGNGKQKEDSKQQSTCGRQRVRATGGLPGVMELNPCGCDPNFCAVAAPGCQKLPPPYPGSKKTKKLKQQSNGGIGHAGSIGNAQGVMELPLPFCNLI